MSSNVVLIGKMVDYNKNYNLINSQIQKGLINVKCMVFEESNLLSIDGLTVYSSLNQIKNIEFDYFILLTEDKQYYDEISEENNFKQKIIPVRVFNLPDFNFEKYQKLLENPPSIISRHCWGGLVSHELGLPFKSPFVNLFINEVDFNKLVSNFSHYMNQDLEFIREGFDPILDSKYPIIKLDDIVLHFNHYKSFEEAKNKWDERRKRINYDNLLFETTTEYKSIALQFKSFNLTNKICFCLDDIEGDYMINFQDYITDFSKGKLGMNVNGTATGEIPYFDLIELILNHDYTSRIKINHKTNYQRNYDYYKTTKYYEMEYSRFFGLDAQVPWDLNNKIESYKFTDQLNIKHPKILHYLDDISLLKTLDETKQLPEKFCLKKYTKSTNRDVLLLNKLKNGTYLDDLSKKSGTIDELINKINSYEQKNKPEKTQFFIEETVGSVLKDMKVPLEYKVFLFNGIPKLILQVNRNSKTYSINLFDGNFIPLKEGRDWYINKELAYPGIPIISPYAYEILIQSMKIAEEIGDKHIVIDWLDNGKDLFFGELSFATKATFSGMFSLSREILLNIENSLEQELTNDYMEKGYRLDTKKLHENIGQELNFKTEEYYDLLNSWIDGELDSLNKIVTYFEKLVINEEDDIKKRLYQHLEIAWLELLLLYDSLSTEKLCRQINAGWGFIFLKTYYFNKRISESKIILEDKAQASDWYKIRWAQFIFDVGGSDGEITKAKKYVEKYANESMDYAIEVKNKYGL